MLRHSNQRSENYSCKQRETNEDPKPAKAYLGILHTKGITHSIITGFMMLANCSAFFTSSPLNATMLVLTGMGHRQHHLTPSFGISGSLWKQPKHTGNNSNSHMSAYLRKQPSHMSASLRKQPKQSHVGISPETTQTVTCRHLSGNNPVTCRHLSGNNPNSHMSASLRKQPKQSHVGISPETTQTVTCRHPSGNNPNSHTLGFSWHGCNQSQARVP